MTKDKDWNEILADAIARGEIDFFEGKRIQNWQQRKQIIKKLWSKSEENESR